MSSFQPECEDFIESMLEYIDILIAWREHKPHSIYHTKKWERNESRFKGLSLENVVYDGLPNYRFNLLCMWRDNGLDLLNRMVAQREEE
tara:strand:+ start:1171 stop:1437 length:267 start_codon:yes stop_codon:yes gene_type:complete